MKLTLTVKPTKYVARTKDDLMRKMKMAGYSSSSMFGDSRYAYSLNSKDPIDGFIMVYTCQKYRPKFKQTKDSRGITKSSKKVFHGYWEGHVYRIPKAFLQAAGLKVEQGLRTFKLVKRRG